MNPRIVWNSLLCITYKRPYNGERLVCHEFRDSYIEALDRAVELSKTVVNQDECVIVKRDDVLYVQIKGMC